MAVLEVHLLGTFHVTLDGEPVTSFATDKARALLAYLVAELDRPHRRDTLAGLLWPDQPQNKARQSLRQALSHIRQAIEQEETANFLLVTREAVQFNTESDYDVDVIAFTALYEATIRHRHRGVGACRTCLKHLEEMTALYRGDFLKGFSLEDSGEFEEWALLKREWYHLHIVEALTILSRYHEWRSDYAQARDYVQRLVMLEPWREEAHRQLMILLAREGQRSAALMQYQKCRQALRNELGVEPTAETVTLLEQIRDVSFPSFSSAPVLPQFSTPFVGREEERAALHDLLANPDCRIVTLIGPGGIGKSRLALQVAQEQLGLFQHGIAFVPLAAINSTELLIAALMEVLNIPARGQSLKAQVLDYLREKAMLLVLDNFEQLLDSASVLMDVLRAARGVVLLVTSRERLNLREEWVYTVGGLTYPKDDVTPDINHSAVTLFVQRAQQAGAECVGGSPGGAVTSPITEPHTVSEQRAIARVCRLVEGMPLAVELAAALTAVRTCEDIAEEIERNLDILTTRLRNMPPRHRSIRAAFEHSWELLSGEEQMLFARLSVFQGDFDMLAVKAVTGATVIILSALLDKSLIRRAVPGRYDMHGLLRQYAAERLAADPPTLAQTRERYARHFAAFLAQQEVRLAGIEKECVLSEIALELENARHTWQLAVLHGWDDVVEQSLGSLYNFFRVRGRFSEGITLLEAVLESWFPRVIRDLDVHEKAQPPCFGEPFVPKSLSSLSLEEATGVDVPLEQLSLLGRVLTRLGVLYRYQGRYQPARRCLAQALVIAGKVDDDREHAFTLVNLAGVIIHSHISYEEAIQMARRGLALSEQIGYRWGITMALHVLGMAWYRLGDIAQAETHLANSLAIARESADPYLILSPLNSIGDVICHRGDYVRAQQIFEECLALSRKIGDRYRVAIHLNNLGTILHTREKYEDAWTIYQESLTLCREIGDQNGMAIALSNLGEVAYVLGNYAEAQGFYQEGLAIGRALQDQRVVMVCLNNLGEVLCAQGDCEKARAYFTEVLDLTYQTQTLPMLFKVLVNLAVFFDRLGQSDRVVALLTVASHHPASECVTQELAAHLLADLIVSPYPKEPRKTDAPDALDVLVAETLVALKSQA